MSRVNFLLRRTRLAFQEFGPSMALLMMPGGYFIVLTGWIHRAIRRTPHHQRCRSMRFPLLQEYPYVR
jgi:cytochrome bd-type quinol oxidase subunit 1